jgi:hypothetical protein
MKFVWAVFGMWKRLRHGGLPMIRSDLKSSRWPSGVARSGCWIKELFHKEPVCIVRFTCFSCGNPLLIVSGLGWVDFPQRNGIENVGTSLCRIIFFHDRTVKTGYIAIDERRCSMGIGVIFKLVAFLLWPFLLLFLYYLADKEDFKRKFERIRRESFKK